MFTTLNIISTAIFIGIIILIDSAALRCTDM